MLLDQFLHLLGKAIPLVFQLLVQTEPVLIHLSLQLVFQSHQLFLVLPSHALVAQYLLPQLRILLVLLYLASELATQDTDSLYTVFGWREQLSLISEATICIE